MKYQSAEVAQSPASTDAMVPPSRQVLAHQLRIHAHAVVLDGKDTLDVAVLGRDCHVAHAFFVLEAMSHCVLHQWLDEQARYRYGEHLRRNSQHDLQPVTESRSLEFEVGVDGL